MRYTIAIAVALISLLSLAQWGLADVVPNPGHALVQNTSTGSGSSCSPGTLSMTYSPLPVDSGFLLKFVDQGNCIFDVYYGSEGSEVGAGSSFVEAFWAEYQPPGAPAMYPYLHVVQFVPTFGCPAVYAHNEVTADPAGNIGTNSTDYEGAGLACWTTQSYDWVSTPYHWAMSYAAGKSTGVGSCRFEPRWMQVPGALGPQWGCYYGGNFEIGLPDIDIEDWTLVHNDLDPGEAVEIDLPDR